MRLGVADVSERRPLPRSTFVQTLRPAILPHAGGAKYAKVLEILCVLTGLGARQVPESNQLYSYPTVDIITKWVNPHPVMHFSNAIRSLSAQLKTLKL